MKAYDTVGWMRPEGWVGCEGDPDNTDNDPIFADQEGWEWIVCEHHNCPLGECNGIDPEDF